MGDEGGTGKYGFFAKAVIAVAILAVLVIIFVPGYSGVEDSIINRIFFYYQDPDQAELSVQERAQLLEAIPRMLKEAMDEAADKDFCVGRFDRFDMRFFNAYDLAIINQGEDIDVRPLRKDEYPSVQTLLSSPRIVQNVNTCILSGTSANELVSIIRSIDADGYSSNHLQRLTNLNPIRANYAIYRIVKRDVRADYFILEYNNIRDNLLTERFRHGLDNEYFIKTSQGICLIPIRDNMLNWWTGTWRPSCRTNEGVLRSSCVELLYEIAVENDLKCSSTTPEIYEFQFRVEVTSEYEGLQIVSGERLNIREDSAVTALTLINDARFEFDLDKSYSFKTSSYLNAYDIRDGQIFDCVPEYEGSTVINSCNFIGFKTSQINIEVIE